MASSAPGYSVLTHEAIIDAAWELSIKPLLLRQFPGAEADKLVEAHAYVYGGSIIQDMGYYPFGSEFFSDLVHYMRAGDFVQNLLREAHTLNEYAFALGALAHYAADTRGHPLAVNRSVPLEYPELEPRFGVVITYAMKPSAHLKTEFGFDVLQVARGNYAPKNYHDFIGFKVAKPVLERAFEDTYDLRLADVFTSLDLALGTYRYSVSSLIPEMTKVAWNLKKDEIVKAAPTITRRKFLYNISRSSYEKEWDREYRRPGVGARVLAFLFRLIPKFGPLRALSFRPPTQQTAQLFMLSFNRTLDAYRWYLAAVSTGSLVLANLNLDTGQKAHAGEYPLADDAYSQLLRKLSDSDFRGADQMLRADLLAWFGDPNTPIATRKKPQEWRDTMAALEKLRAVQRAAAVSLFDGVSDRH